MVENLFSSQVTFKILSMLFRTPHKQFSTSDIIAETGKNQTNVLRELEKLVEWRIVEKTKNGNQNFYKINELYSFFESLKKLFDDYSYKQKKYFLLNEEGRVSLLSLSPFVVGYTSDLAVKRGILPRVTDILSHYKNDYAWFYFEKEPFEENAKSSLKKLLSDASFVKKIIYAETLEKGNQALKECKKIQKKDFKLSKKEAVAFIDFLFDVIKTQISLNYIAVLDLKDQIYSNYLKDYLGERVKGKDMSVNALMEQLLTPEYVTYTQQLRIEMLQLAIKAKKSKSENYSSEIEEIWNKWKWLSFSYRGPEFELDYFTHTFTELLKKPLKTLEAELEMLTHYSENILKDKKALYKKFGIDTKHQEFIEALSVLSYLKIYRKDTAFLLFFTFYSMLKHFNKKINQDNLYYLTAKEAIQLINGTLSISRSELVARETNSVHCGMEDNVIVGDEAQKFVDRVVEKEDPIAALGGKISVLDGTTACLGKTGNWVYGKVKIINVPADMEKMEQGDILISVATTPDIMQAMKKASAIVTDHGGITCHAAIVSRELNIPCLIATKYATKVFKDDDRVIVCPRHGHIKFDEGVL